LEIKKGFLGDITALIFQSSIFRIFVIIANTMLIAVLGQYRNPDETVRTINSLAWSIKVARISGIE
jgi:hypothetical protein